MRLSPDGNSYQIFASFEHNRDAILKTGAIDFSLFEDSNLITQRRFEANCVGGGPGEKYLVKDDVIYGKFDISKEGIYRIDVALPEKPINFHDFHIYINAGQNKRLLYVAYTVTSFFFVISLALGISNVVIYFRKK